MCTKAEVEEAIKAALENAHKDFWVNAETHFIHHQAIEGWLKTFGVAKKSIVVSFVVGLFAGLITIFWLGFAAFMKLKGGIT